MTAGPDRDRPRMQLLDWKRLDKGALVGRATVLLPSGLQISDIGVFTKDARRWAQMPAEAMRSADGQPIKDEREDPVSLAPKMGNP